MKKNIFIVFVILLITLIVVSGMAFVWWKNELKAPSSNAATHTVLITKGSNASTIAKKLHDAGVIKNEFAFRLYTKIYKQATNLPVGEFQVPGNLAVPQVIAFLLKGPQEVWVTVPEGLRREEIPAKFSTALGMTDAEARRFNDEFLEASENDEGYLFPETYLVPKEVTAQKAVTLMKATFQKKFTASSRDVVTLASLLERETRTDEEKPIVAGIMFNRISQGMPLQIDATVQYAKANLSCSNTGTKCADWWPTVYLDDYKLKSSFNTYVISGLPPSPISNPGLTSLNAAANPSKSNYLFYIHDKSGGIHYAETLDEHNANVQKYLR